jgi:hypothetical protein
VPKAAAGPDLPLYRRAALGIGLLMFAVARPVSPPRPVDERANRQEDETRDNEERGEHHDANVPPQPARLPVFDYLLELYRDTALAGLLVVGLPLLFVAPLIAADKDDTAVHGWISSLNFIGAILVAAALVWRVDRAVFSIALGVLALGLSFAAQSLAGTLGAGSVLRYREQLRRRCADAWDDVAASSPGVPP